MIRKTLEQVGYEVDEAEDGRVGLSRFQDPAYRVDLLITDIVMPRMSGTDLAARVLASRPGAKVLFMSGYATDSTAREMLTRAGVNFVQKPFDAELLTECVREILEED